MRIHHFVGEFPEGEVFVTPSVLEAVSEGGCIIEPTRHSNGDSGAMLLSTYTISQGVRFWFSTEYDRSMKMLLLY